MGGGGRGAGGLYDLQCLTNLNAAPIFQTTMSIFIRTSHRVPTAQGKHREFCLLKL